jgi:hypothetical protein
MLLMGVTKRSFIHFGLVKLLYKTIYYDILSTYLSLKQ